MTWTRSSRCDSNHCLETAYRRSTYSTAANGACLEAAYRKSSRSHSGDCLEAAYQGMVLVRDSKLLDRVTGQYCGPILSFPSPDWEQFLANLPERP